MRSLTQNLFQFRHLGRIPLTVRDGAVTSGGNRAEGGRNSLSTVWTMDVSQFYTAGLNRTEHDSSRPL